MAESLKIRRIKKGLMQLDLARRLNVSETTISAWETGRRNPTKKNIIELNKILNNNKKEGAAK